MNIQINQTGDIVSINAPQPHPDLITLDIDVPNEVLKTPEQYRYLEGEWVRQSRDTKLAQAKAYLAATDFYVTRKLETGMAVPKEIQLNRDQCRALLITALPNTDFLASDEA